MAPHTNHSAQSPARPVVPRATYRFQFHAGFTLREATALVPYLAGLGVSHVYASPWLKPRRGSTHGYDVCDTSQLNPELGTPAELETFITTLRRHGLSVVLDIVPNHMGIGTPENRWWWDVLRHGPASRFAGHFDFHWDSHDPRRQGKVLIPILGDRYPRVLAKTELRLEESGGELSLRYFEHCFPLAPESIPSTPESKGNWVARLNANPDALDALIQKQHYRLVYWRHGDAEVNYRRFFNITSLAALRMELPRVFNDTHRLLQSWLKRGWLDGLRVDHPDGLRDPGAYLRRLREIAPQAWIVVEKILAADESLPADWPIAGTTGYEFLNRLNGLFVDPEGEAPLTQLYFNFTGEPIEYAPLLREKKRLVLRNLLGAEVQQLTQLLLEISAWHWTYRDFTEAELREGVIQMAAALPVYRTYATDLDTRLSAEDEARIRQAATIAQRERSDLPSALFDFLRELLLLHVRGNLEHDFAMRFQQFTGPAMAKGAEDTAFYCFNRLLSLNEVGGEPNRFGTRPEEFHRVCRQTAYHWPDTMLTTSTHDTKRSEDVRARLNLLTEIPALWREAVHRWSALNERHRRQGWPDRNAEYLYYQTLVGAWPLSVERAVACLEKSVREAKQHTSWVWTNSTYEQALREFVTATLADTEFVADVERFVGRLVEPGYVNSLAQTLVKLTAPGVPDIYQGTELWAFSLVDPDNRRPVDYAVRRRFLDESQGLDPAAAWERRATGLAKLWLIRKVLDFRRRRPELFGRQGNYQPLSATGVRAQHVLAFGRGQGAVTVVPRLVMRLQHDWADTTLELQKGAWQNELTGEALPNWTCAVADLFRSFPVAFLVRKEAA